jgi:HNH endonuclease
MKTTCCIDGCEKPRYQGRYRMCCMHEKRRRKYGSPFIVERIFNDDVARFWSYVNKTETCWLWTGSKTKSSGRTKYYGRLNIAGKHVKAHRYSYELNVGPIPEGLTLDHIASKCTSTLCVNYDHLEPVTREENSRRYFAQFEGCINGHLYTPENTYIRPDNGTRMCRTCPKERKNGT